MKLDLVDPGSLPSVQLSAPDGSFRRPGDLAREVAASSGGPIRLASAAPLVASEAADLFRALEPLGRPFIVRLSAEAILNKAAVDEAARSGCIAIEIEREGLLVEALGSATFAGKTVFDAFITSLRRARGLGLATVARLALGMPGDDEGVFDRTLRFSRRALISVPVPVYYQSPLQAGAASSDLTAFMDRASLENGIGWLRSRLGRHHAIWRRALWPTGSRRLALTAGYRLRRDTAAGAVGRYTPTMHLLRLLNRTKRTGRIDRMLTTCDLAEDAASSAGRGWLRTHAWSDARLGALFIQVEGALDLRGARALTKRVSEACQAGFERVTIDFRGLERVSVEVVTRFLEENHARLAELGRYTQIRNLGVAIDSLRRQLGDVEPLRWVESAALHA